MRLTGTLTVDLPDLGLQFQRSRRAAVAQTGSLEWVDPVVGARIRHDMRKAKNFVSKATWWFGVGSEFSWQAVATYGFDVNCFGTPLHTVIGYRALAVITVRMEVGENALDIVQHGPVMGVTFNW